MSHTASQEPLPSSGNGLGSDNYNDTNNKILITSPDCCEIACLTINDDHTIPDTHHDLLPRSRLYAAKKPTISQHDALKRLDSDGLARECEAYSQHINNLLAPYAEQLGRYLPVQKETIFQALQDGVLLSYIIHMIRPQCIDLKQIKMDLNLAHLNQPQSKAIFEVTNNHNIVLKAAKATGIKIVNIGSEDILSMHPTLMLGLIWQLVRLFFLDQVNIQTHPELIKLAQHDESITDLMQMSSETILLRWVNFHLLKSNSTKQIQNLGRDLSDSIAYAFLLTQILPRSSILNDLIEKIIVPLKNGKEPELDQLSRAQLVLDQIKHVNIETFVTANDIASGHSRLNLCLVAELFNRFVGIQMMTEEQMSDLTQERDALQIKISQMEAELARLHSGIDDEKQAWEHLVVEERQMYGQKLDELRAVYEEELSEFKERYLMETETLNRKLVQQRNIFENTIEELIHIVNGASGQLGNVLRLMAVSNNSSQQVGELAGTIDRSASESRSPPESPKSVASSQTCGSSSLRKSQSLRNRSYDTEDLRNMDDDLIPTSYQRGSPKHLCDLVRKLARNISSVSDSYERLADRMTGLQNELQRTEHINQQFNKKVVEYVETVVKKKSGDGKKKSILKWQ